MKKEAKRIDYLNDGCFSVLRAVIAPLAVTTVVQIFTTTLVNKLYSQYVGEEYFTIIGYLNTFLMCYYNLLSSVSSAAWIRTARYYARKNSAETQEKTLQAIFAIVLSYVGVTLVMILLQKMIFTWMNIPAEIYEQASAYYRLCLAVYFPSLVSGFLSTIVIAISASGRILLMNLFSTMLTVVTAFVLLVVLKLGLIGGTIAGGCNSFIMLYVYITILCRDGWWILKRPGKICFQRRIVTSIISYGALLSLQWILCNTGYLLVSAQTNKYLSMQYVSVLQVSLPITGLMSAFMQSCSLFIPQNYAEGKMDRVKRFFMISTLGCVIYGIICFIVQWSLGEWYYGTLFSSPEIIKLGKEYWFWNGLGTISVAVIYTARTFFDVVGYGKISLLAGVGELSGHMLSALWLIPKFGNIGRSLAYPLGWTFAAVALLVSYYLLKGKIYKKDGSASIAS